MSPATVDSPQSWTRLAIALAIATIGGVGMWSVVVVLPAVQAEFGVARAAASLPYTLTMLGFGVAGIAARPLVGPVRHHASGPRRVGRARRRLRRVGVRDDTHRSSRSRRDC